SASGRGGPSPSTASGTVQWNLERIVDLSGNAIEYSYTLDQNQLYLARIDYTFNANESPMRSVRFWYESRPDVETSYTGPMVQRTAWRLASIQVIGYRPAGMTSGAWSLRYAQSAVSGRSLLSDIRRFGTDVRLDELGRITDGASLPPMT